MQRKKSSPSTPTSFYDDQFLLRLNHDHKQRLQSKATLASVSLSDALRIGGEQYLDDLLAEKKGDKETDPLLSEFRSLAARVESRLQDGRR